MGFYLEISPRQSGKTTRLLNEVKKCLERNKKEIWIFVPNHTIANSLNNEISKFHQMSTKFSSDRVKIRFASSDGAGYDLENSELFFDEFDYFGPYLWNSIVLALPRRDSLKNAHFYTTPKRIRTLKEFVQRKTDDMLILLLRKNKHNYISYPSLNVNKSKFVMEVSSNQYLTEMEGIFVK